MDDVEPVTPDPQRTPDRTPRRAADRTLASSGHEISGEQGARHPSSRGKGPDPIDAAPAVAGPESVHPGHWMANAPTLPAYGEALRTRSPGEEIGQFRIVGRLGEGGMGVVYAAMDLERGHAVALKTLQRMDPESLARLKNEFRSVADIVHPNLVSLYELYSIEGEWFFTMELIDGVSFLAHVREDARAKEARTVSSAGSRSPKPTPASAPSPPDPPPPAPAAPPPRPPPAIDAGGLGRLRPALRHLAAGVQALHDAGKLHRDLKPGNVMVTRGGRVVVLDFGLARSATPETLDPAEERAGTPAYMAPEQAWGHTSGEPADWYAVGAMLYQALTGRLPFEGSIVDIIRAKRKGAVPPAPSTIAPGVPADLDALCVDLLRPRAEDRPTGPEVITRLVEAEGIGPVSRPSRPTPTPGSAFAVARRPSLTPPPGSTSGAPVREPHVSAPNAQGPAPSNGDGGPISGPSSGESPGAAPSGVQGLVPSRLIAPFVGREACLTALEEAYAQAAAGAAVTIHVHGRSGMGKTALVRRFLDGIRRRGEAVVLEGRCYERESVPYKAFDSLVDALARHLQRMPPERAAALLPPEAQDLARMFPVLQGVEASLAAAGHWRVDASPDCDPQELRRRAFRGLKGLLAHIGRERPLVVWIDDLQWGDRDSAHLLVELIAPPDPPPLMLLGTYRSEEAATSPLLRELRRDEPGAAARGDAARAIEVGPLPREDATRLALALMGADDEAARAHAAQIARESEGSPLFVEQLVERAATIEGGEAEVPSGGDGVSLEGLIRARLAALPDGARRLLEVIAVAGRPLPQRIALEVSGTLEGAREAVAVLRSGRLVRTRGSRHRDAIDTYHDRIRERAFADLGPAVRKAHHLRLATALEADASPEPEEIARHFHAAGELRRAGDHAVAAADHAADALAFDHAAELYALAIECHPERAGALQQRRAEALVNAGRCAEAAPAYLAAATSAPPREALRLRGLAAEQLLVSGHIEGGVDVLRPALRAIGLSYPETPARALLSVLASMARLALRGTRFDERRPEDLPDDEALRLDLCFGAAKGLIAYDPIRAASFLFEYVLLALRAGDPHHVARALVFYGMLTVFEGAPRGIRKGTALMDEAERVARPLGSPYHTGVALGCRGISEISAGRFRQAVTLLAEGIDILKRRCRGVRWEIGTCQNATVGGLFWLGELRELGDRAPGWIREAELIGDRFCIVELELYYSSCDIAAGDLDEARERVRRTIRSWTKDTYTHQHWNALKMEAWCDLHEGRPEAARARLAAEWSALEKSQMLRVRLYLIDALFLRASVAIACAAGDQAKACLKVAARDAAGLEKIEREPGGASAALIRALIAAARGDDRAALAAFDAAIGGFDAAGMILHAACARRRKGELIGGDAGRRLVERADAAMNGEGVADPERFAAVLAPMAPGAPKR